jgi:CysZ protein
MFASGRALVSVRRAASLIFDPAFRGMVIRSVLFTVLLFAAGLALTEWGLAQLPVLGNPAVNHILELLAPVLFIFLLGALGGPVTALFGSLFLDKFATGIEAREYPRDTPGGSGAFLVTLKAGLRLTALVLGADIALLPLDIGLPGVGELMSLLVNGWLLGREYFEMTALRHVPLADADALRRANGGVILLGGVLISLLSVIPGLDLIAPLFGTALMVHLFKQIQKGVP